MVQNIFTKGQLHSLPLVYEAVRFEANELFYIFSHINGVTLGTSVSVTQMSA